MRFLSIFLLSFPFMAAAAPEAGFMSSDGMEVAGLPPALDTLETCPKFGEFSAARAYPGLSSGLREVSEVSAEALPLPEDDMGKEGLLESLRLTLSYWKKRPDAFRIKIGPDSYGAPRMRDTTQRLINLFEAGLSGQELHKALKDDFRVYRSVADDGSGKIVLTGYYEAEIKAAKKPDETHKFPVHLKPPDLIKTTPDMGVDFDYGRIDQNGKLVRYYPRQEISGGALAGQDLELVWSEHPALIMLLQIQGSGIVRFPDGDFIKTGFDGANGWPFKSVQKLLKDCGEIPDMSFKDFISYLAKQGGRESRLVDLNPRYVFFKQRPKDSPAYGAIGTALIPGRSIAVDPGPLPLGITALIRSKRPVAGQNGSLAFKDFTRFVQAHDTGSAIRGPGRIDLFWGAGETAETEASAMKAKGDIFILIAK